METILHSTEGGSDKLYRVEIVGSGNTFSVRCANCRVGNPWVDQGFKATNVELLIAEKEATKVINGKLKKGYHIKSSSQEVNSTVQQTVAAMEARIAPTRTSNRPQLLNVIEEGEALLYAASHAWVAQEKHDGVRHMIYRKAGVLGASNKLGNETSMERKVMCSFEGITKPFVVDGELVGEVFHAFDLLEADGLDLRRQSYNERYRYLTNWMKDNVIPSDHVVLVESHVGCPGIVAELLSKGAEGVVFKRRSAVYEAGRPSSGGDQFKYKFTNTASFIVTGQNGNKRSVSLGLFESESALGNNQNQPTVAVGSCTIPANKEIPSDGSVVEVRYLYAYRGGSIYQPCYLGERNDIISIECQMSQLRYKGEGSDLTEDDEG
jgi:bifunctional non-homologous end joining protein LigD